MTSATRLDLPTVTLVAATSVNLDATIAAMQRCVAKVRFARTILFTHEACPDQGPQIERIEIEPLGSAAAYSRFMLRDLAAHVETAHCLVVQWDGFILDPECWTDAFFDYDYIGAAWPQFSDGQVVGNGGFSLRSKAMLDACRQPEFITRNEPEDVAICRTNRAILESRYGMRFADTDTAYRFSYERAKRGPTFGFHGIFNLIDAIGPDAFWEVYTGLDRPNAVPADLRRIAWRLMTVPNGFHRAIRVFRDSLLR